MYFGWCPTSYVSAPSAPNGALVGHSSGRPHQATRFTPTAHGCWIYIHIPSAPKWGTFDKGAPSAPNGALNGTLNGALNEALKRSWMLATGLEGLKFVPQK